MPSTRTLSRLRGTVAAITDTEIMLFGDNDYPPKRGTMLAISETEGLLYTRVTE